jgi:hypothetical protein
VVDDSVMVSVVDDSKLVVAGGVMKRWMVTVVARES